ncbi:hypothetical protein JXR93_03315 [bacterium]|nr:hypothetical protein [bacterium]
MLKIVFLLFISIFFVACDSGSEIEKNKPDGSSCEYDSNCISTSICDRTLSICTAIKNSSSTVKCLHNSDCDDKCDGSPCQCLSGLCREYNPCSANPCLALNDPNREGCSIVGDSYECVCSDGFVLISGRCTLECAFGRPNDTNDGCICNTGYVYDEETQKCIYDCSAKPFSHPNETNNGCLCNENYLPEGNSCFYDCSTQSHSERNSTNDGCDCVIGYVESFGLCCQDNSTNINGTCKCNTGYHQEGELCVLSTPCNPNPCTESNKNQCSINGENFICSCNDGYHEDGGLCCPEYYSNQNGVCTSDYTYCGSDLDCLAGDMCVIQSRDEELVSYCVIPSNDGKSGGVACETDSDCQSGTCIQSSNGKYCAQLCNSSNSSNVCQDACIIEGTAQQADCLVDSTLGFTRAKCICSEPYTAMGDECIILSALRGDECGKLPELEIKSSGIYIANTSDYTNKNDNTGGCQTGGGNDVVFKMVLEKAGTVTLEIADSTIPLPGAIIDDTVLYVKSTCEGSNIACNDDISTGVRRSKISQTFEAGTYYIFVDGYRTTDVGWFALIANIVPLSCKNGTSCLQENIEINNISDDFNVCKPTSDGSGLITRCYAQDDCSDGRVCRFNGSTISSVFLGCNLNQTNYIMDYETYVAGKDCRTGLRKTSNNECRAFCKTQEDCRVGYDCNSFSVSLTGGTYNSSVDNYKLCDLRDGVSLCKRDGDCSVDNFCMVDDNKDNRLYSRCKYRRNGFETANIGTNCSTGAYKNCYNYACYQPGYEGNSSFQATPYCTATCATNSDCPDTYECTDGNIIYPKEEFVNTAVCKPNDLTNCITSSMNVCVKNRTLCTSNSSCSNGEICTISANNQSNGHYLYCSPEIGAKNNGESCTTGTECKSGICYIKDAARPSERVCIAPCTETSQCSDHGQGYDCLSQYISYQLIKTAQNLCVPYCADDSECFNGEVCKLSLNNQGTALVSYCGSSVGTKAIGDSCSSDSECIHGACSSSKCVAPCTSGTFSSVTHGGFTTNYNVCGL